MAEPFVVDEFQEAVLDTVRRYVDEVVRPVAADLDRNTDPEDSFSWDIVEKADAAGIRTMTLSEENGGIGADSLTTAMVIEELAKADMGIAVVMAQTLKLAQVLQKATTPEQRDRYVPIFRDDPRGLLAIGITEPETASNYFLPHPSPFRTAAEKTEGGWVINGMKHFISNGNRSGIYLVFVQTEKSKGLAEGSTCFLIERDTPGFSIGHVHDKMGERLANNAELVFTDCFIADENVVGTVGDGFNVLAQFFPQSNTYAAATVLGVAVTAYERALEWAKIRNQGGKPIIEHDGIRAQLAEMRMLNDVSRTYIHRAAWSADNQDQGWDKTLGTLPKEFASQAAWKVVTWASEIHGGYGYMDEYPIGQMYADARVQRIYGGANEVMKMLIARTM